MRRHVPAGFELEKNRTLRKCGKFIAKLTIDEIFPEMGYIQPLVENENSAKLQNCVILTYVRSFLDYDIINILSTVFRCFKYAEPWKISKMTINRSGETTVELANQRRKSFVFLH